MSQKPIPPNPPRWKPNPDPANIVIPGLDTDASTNDQIEQIEQLITIKLQNIDENFSKIHNVLANKLLPAVKRYAVGTEPVREAAKFWTSFYEQAAQIRIPTYDDYSTFNEIPSERDDETESSSQDNASEASGDRTEQPHEVYETTVNSETSFLPGQGAFSSTPATARQASTYQSFTSQASDDPSWTRSMESPFDRLDREIKHFSSQEESTRPASSSSIGLDSIVDDEDTLDEASQRDTTVTIPRSAKGKGKDTSHPLLKNVLRHNLYNASDNSSFEIKSTSPLKFRGKPKTPTVDKKLNPYLPSDDSSTNWSGVVDLRDPSVLTPQQHRSGKATANRTTTPGGDDGDDDSFDAMPPGMSPLALMSPARPPRSSAELGMLMKLGQTPTKEASERIQRDLLKSALKSGGRSGTTGGRFTFTRQEKAGSETSMSTVPTPPSLSRYARPRYDYSTASSSMTKDPTLDGMIRHIRDDIMVGGSRSTASGGSKTTLVAGKSSTPGLRVKPRAVQQQQQQQAKAGKSPLSLISRLSQKQPEQSRFSRPSAQGSSAPPPAPARHAEPATPVYESLHPHAQDHDDIDSDSDSLDSLNNTAHPSAAFLMASGGAPGVVYDDEDSFGSNHSSDSLENEIMDPATGIVPVHPFAGISSEGVVEDDGFDDDDDDSSDGFEVGVAPGGAFGGDGYQEETVFGLAPAQRRRPSELRMLGEDLLQDTIGIGAHMAASGRGVEESPTPANWGR